MASSRWVMTMLLFVAVIGSVSSLGSTAYGDQPYDGGGNPSQDAGFIEGILGFVSGAVGPLLSFAQSFVPAFTGVWVIDDLIINPMLAYSVYVGVSLVFGLVS